MCLDRGDVPNERNVTNHDPRYSCGPAHKRKHCPPASRGSESDPRHRRHQSKGSPLAQFRDRKALHPESSRNNHQNSNRHFTEEDQHSEPDWEEVVVHGCTDTDEKHGAISNRIENLAQFAHLLETARDVSVDPISRRQQPEEPAASNDAPIGKQTDECWKHGKTKERQRIRDGQIFTNTHTAMVAPSVMRDREWT